MEATSIPASQPCVPEHEASLRTSSEIALATLLMEVGASVKVDCIVFCGTNAGLGSLVSNA